MGWPDTFLDRTKPDMQTALRYMRIARRAGWLAFPFIEDEELRRRIVGYKPMSEEEVESALAIGHGKSKVSLPSNCLRFSRRQRLVKRYLQLVTDMTDARKARD